MSLSLSGGFERARLLSAPLWVSGLLFFAVFLVDLTAPPGYVITVAYVPIVFCSVWFSYPRTPFVFAAAATALDGLAMALRSLGGAQSVYWTTNTAVILGAVWFTAALVYLHCITEATKRRSQEKASQLAAIVDSSDDAIISESLDGKVGSWNAGAERLFGYGAAEIVGQDTNVLVPESLKREEVSDLDRVRQGNTVRRLDTLRTHKSGRTLNVSISVSPIRAASGEIIGASRIARDITPGKQAEEKFRLVVELAPNAMVMGDEHGRIVLINTETEKLFGYARSDLLGQSMEVLVPNLFDGMAAEPPVGILASKIVGTAGSGRELWGMRSDRSRFPLELGLIPVQSRDGLLILGAIVDISARLRAADELRKFNETLERQVVERTTQLRAANLELEEFAYVASHDLKAPLRVIDNASKWLEEDLQQYLTDDTRESMTLLRGRIRRMEKLLDDLLAYSRIGREIGNKDVEMISGNVLIENILMMISPPAAFQVNVCGDFVGIQVTRMPLQQILMNLIGNAIKHHHKSFGSIVVGVEDRGDHFAFAVSDDGPGIDARFHDQIFKMFQTMKPKDQVEGSGMGLAMVRKNVEVCGGSVKLESAEGKGSTFRFTWPKVYGPTEKAA